MRVSVPKIALPLLAIVGVFTLPWKLTLLLSALAALYFPPTALLIGILADILYYPGTGLPTASLYGAGIALAAAGVRWFAETRILRP